MIDTDMPNQEGSDPTPISSEDIAKALGPIDGSKRAEAAHRTDLMHERQEWLEEKKDIIQQIKGGDDNPELLDRLGQLNYDLRTTEAEVDSSEGTIAIDQADDDIISE
jgi:hypothetical protein